MDKRGNQTPSLESSPKALALFTPIVRGSPYVRGKITPNQLRFSPVRTVGRIYLTTPRLKREVPGSVECTPEVLRKLVSPPPGFDSSDYKPCDPPSDETPFSATRRLDYLEQIEEAPERLLAALKKHISETPGLNPESQVKVLLESLVSQSDQCSDRCSIETQTDFPHSPIEATQDIIDLRKHINSISAFHALEVQRIHCEYREKLRISEESRKSNENYWEKRVKIIENQLRNANFVLESRGLSGLDLGDVIECLECGGLRDRVTALSDQLALSQDYIRKSGFGTASPLLLVQRGKDHRISVHKQVILIEELFSSPQASVSHLKEEFLRLPYLLKPLFDLLKEYERMATCGKQRGKRGNPLETVDENLG